VLGHEILIAEGKPGTEENLTRAEWKLRKALRSARKRRAGNIGHATSVAAGRDKHSTGDMKVLRKRVIEETWYEAPDGAEAAAHEDELADVGDSDPDLDGDLDDLDEDLGDADLDDYGEEG
jgi:hypothetical protein